MGHDNHRRLSKLYAWEEKQSKTSRGAQTVDYEKIAAAPLQTMKASDLYRFPVVCSLVSDLYCPGYDPRQPLTKDSNLMRTAARYKIDSAKTTAAIRAERPVKPTSHRSGAVMSKKPGNQTTHRYEAETKKARK